MHKARWLEMLRTRLPTRRLRSRRGAYGAGAAHGDAAEETPDEIPQTGKQTRGYSGKDWGMQPRKFRGEACRQTRRLKGEACRRVDSVDRNADIG